jgi:arylsulfatase A-like enzyme/Flp pilus assembly protein TadD
MFERFRDKGHWFFIAILLALTIGGLAWQQISIRHKPNVLLITVDTLRADRVGCYGFHLARTPNMDQLAAEGVRFHDAVASAPITMPSHSTIMTGLHPPAHGVRDNGTFSLDDGVVTLAERFKEAGYETQAFVSAIVLSRRYNLDQGFDGYDDDLWAEDAPKMFMIRDRPARKTADRFLEWYGAWRAGKDRPPFMAWVHLFDPHQPYEPPGWATALTPSGYDAEIAAADHALGRIFEALREDGVLDDTLVVLTADHGESLGEHREKTHAIFIYEATVRVPLIIRYPGMFPKNRIYEGPVRSVDIAPTILAAARLPGGKETQGVNLLPLVRGGQQPPDLPQYSESLLAELGFGMAPLYGVRLGGYKWIRAPRPEVYDLKNDPRELTNIYKTEQVRAQELDQVLEGILDESSHWNFASVSNPMDQESMENLMALGYLAKPADRAGVKGMDPKDGIVIYTRLEEARHLAQAGRWAESEAGLREILAEIPGHISARNTLALALIKQGRPAEAREEYIKSLSYDPEQNRNYALLGNLALAEKDLDGAEKYLREAVRITPRFVEAWTHLALIEILRGREEAGQALLTKAASMDPSHPNVYRRISNYLYQERDYARALPYFKKSLEQAPTDYNSLILGGNSALNLGQADLAGTWYEQAARVRPETWLPWYNLACVKAAGRDWPGALLLLGTALDKGFDDENLLATDKDLAGVRELPEYGEVLQGVRVNRAKGRQGERPVEG